MTNFTTYIRENVYNSVLKDILKMINLEIIECKAENHAKIMIFDNNDKCIITFIKINAINYDRLDYIQIKKLDNENSVIKLVHCDSDRIMINEFNVIKNKDIIKSEFINEQNLNDILCNFILNNK